MKKVIALILALAMVLCLVACGAKEEAAPADSSDKTPEAAPETSSAEPAEGKKLVIWLEQLFNEKPTDMITERIKEWGEVNGVEVEVSLVGAVDFANKLSAAIEGGGMPDVFASKYHRSLNFYPQTIAADVTELYEEIDANVGGFFDSCKSSCYIDGVARTIPFWSSVTLMYCRADKLQEAGYDSLPTTWDEVFEMSRAISDPDNGFFGLGIGCGPTDEDGEAISRIAIWSNGGAFFDEEGNITMDNEATKWWFETYKQLYEDEAIPTDALTWDSAGNNNSYLAGQSGIVFNAATLANALKNNEDNAELYANTWIGPLPAGPDGSIFLEGWTGFAIAEVSENKELAADLLRYLYDVEWYSQWSEYTAPVLGPSIKSVGLSSFWQDDPIHKAIVDTADSGVAYFGYPAKTARGMVVGIKTYYTYKLADMICAVASGDMTYEEAIAAYEAVAQDIAANLQ